MNKDTLDYYNTHAEYFCSNTLHADMHETQTAFLGAVLHAFPDAEKKDIHLLDFGCGSGRDALFFHTLGYAVNACDGSAELVKSAREYTGLEVQQMLFTELNEIKKYQGIWACASILHCSHEELIEVLKRIHDALVPHGILYTSFKYGSDEGMRNGRYFIDCNEKKLDAILKETPGFTVLKQWQTGDVRPGRGNEKWLNVLLQRN
ncbi:MAG: class I SAM-dependent methyltransferase [Bulleidia sp.]|nr:class I SAM-dependent methyltransferase [Bulleidia sp.]